MMSYILLLLAVLLLGAGVSYGVTEDFWTCRESA